MTQRERVLKMLREAGITGVSSGDFLRAYIPRYSARIEELRKDGAAIVTERETASSFRYRLAGGPDLTGDREPRVVPSGPVDSTAAVGLPVATSLFEIGPAEHSHWEQEVA